VVSCVWKINQLNIHNAFLNGTLDEDVYMQQPPGFINFTLSSHVCWLHKSLYGLKQAPWAWYTHLSDYLFSIGFCASKIDSSLFILFIGADIFYLLVYVDDILLTGSNSALLHRLIQLLSSEFKLQDLGAVHYFFGIEVHPTSMSFYKLVDTPISTSKVTVMLNCLFSDPTQFRQIIGAFQYLTFIRPDIYFAINKVCQFMDAFTDTYWAAVKCILCYLKGMISFGLHITRNSSFALHSFTDVNWAGSIDDRKFTGGYLVFFGNTLISWKSSKQRTVTRSSIKTKYKVLANDTAGVL
jgi:hypothetical protein